VNYKYLRSLAFLFSFLFLPLVPNVKAQTTTTGDITGTVIDSSKSAVVSADVEIVSATKGGALKTTTNAAGVFRFSLLEPGEYKLTVSAKGFRAVSRNVQVNIGKITSADTELEVGAQSETITVTEALPLLQTENGDVGTTIENRQVQEVPNPGNDLTYIVQLAPGIVMNTQAGYGNFTANGLPGNSNLFTVNGMDNNDPYLNLNNSGATNLMLGQNEVQEVAVTINGYSGQYGGLAGANVNYTTRSGTNGYHGNLKYWYSGDSLNANNWFNNALSVKRPHSVANEWAADFGGPLKKDKFFFYVNTEGIRVVFATLPTTVLAPSPAYQAATDAKLAANGQTVTQAYYDKYVFPIYNNAIAKAGAGATLTDPNTTSFTVTPANFAPEWIFSTREDWNISSKDRAFIHFGSDIGTQPTYTDPLNPAFNASSYQPQYSGQIHETHTFGPDLINDFIVSGSWYEAIFELTNRAAAAALLPVNVPGGPTLAGTLNWRDGAYNDLNFDGFAFPQGRKVTQYQISDDVVKTRGAHNLRFGLKFRRNDVSDHGFSNRAASPRVRVTASSFQSGTGRLEMRFPTAPEERINYFTLGGYIEDAWRITPKFTLTASLRLDHASNPVCAQLCFDRTVLPFNQLIANPATVDPTGNTIGYKDTISGGNNRALYGVTNLQWQPRVSFAWTPRSGSHPTVVRGGIGIFYDGFQTSAVNALAQNSPLSNRFTTRKGLAWVPGETVGGAAPGYNQFSAAQAFNQALIAGFAQNFTEQQVVNSLPAGLQGAFVAPNYAGTDGFTNVPQYQKWSLEVQQSLWKDGVLSVEYVGNHGIHEAIQNGQYNAYDALGGGTFTPYPTTAPDARFRTANLVQTRAVSNYHGMTASFNQRLGDGQFRFNYTWSRAMDMGTGLSLFNFNTDLSVQTIEDPNNLHLNYGPADWDARHSLNANYVYVFPFKRWLRGHGPDTLVNGWQVSGTAFFRTGFPYTVTDDLGSALFGISNNANVTLFAMQTGTAGNGDCQAVSAINSPINGISATAYPQPHFNGCLNVNNFSGVTTGYSAATRNSFRGPRFTDFDFGLMKKTKIPKWESAEFSVGVQAFNVFNHPNFDMPNQGATANPFFGLVTATVGSPTSIFGSFLGADATPRIVEIKAQFTF
jgi:Carboxypeptidase regulatory-like domain